MYNFIKEDRRARNLKKLVVRKLVDLSLYIDEIYHNLEILYSLIEFLKIHININL